MSRLTITLYCFRDRFYVPRNYSRHTGEMTRMWKEEVEKEEVKK